MSVELVKKAMETFLADPTPEVLCIKGKWGTGKTRAWDDAVKVAEAKRVMAMKKYAYVSLFGINNSSDILQTIFVNANTREGNKINNIIKNMKKIASFSTEHVVVPHISGLGGVARALLSNLVSNTVVCLDDFERKAEGITVNEIMGTIAQLRDARNCKVVLILNEDTLDENELEEFKHYSEKVINSSFQFDPAPTESATIAFPNDDALSRDLREACTQLEITNIRVMQKIGRYARALMELLKDVDPDVVKNVVRSLVVIVWAIITPKDEGAPSLEYISKERLSSFVNDTKERSVDELRWESLLQRYGFSHFDEFDEILATDVNNGFFNVENILSGANKYLKDAQAARAQEAIKAAWEPFHGSFDSNSEEVAKTLSDGLVKHIKYLSPSNLSAAVKILKDIGFGDLGQNLLTSFIESQDDDYSFDLSGDPFSSLVDDPDVLKAFEKKAAEIQKALPTPIEAASMLYKDHFSPEAEEVLAKLSVDDFVTLFKETKGTDQLILVNGCLAFRRISNASERQRHITETARKALLKIGKESALNAHRIVKYRVTVTQSQSEA